jgi:flagellar biosynthetic protein FlhB
LAEGDFQDKTEKATSKKRTEAREKGQVAKGREVASVAVLLTGLSTLYLFGSFIYMNIRSVMQESFSMIATPTLGVTDFLGFNYEMIERFIIIMAPMMIAVFMIAMLSNVAQVGWLFTWEPLIPQPSRVSPIKGIGRLFSKQSLAELFKSITKLTLVGLIAYWAVKGEMGRLVTLGQMEVCSIALYILKVILKIFLRVSLAMIFLAAIDYAFQKWQFEQKLKMTKQEVKEELKQSEGDPLI